MPKPKREPNAEETAATAVEVASFASALNDYDAYAEAQAAEIWGFDELPFPLNLEEQLFVRSYVIDRNDVATMRRLGHRIDDQAKLKARAKKLLSKSEVQSAIEFLAKRMMEKLDVTAEKVQRAIASVAFFDPREVMTFDRFGVHLLHSRFWTAEQAQAIKSIKNGQNGVEIVLYDRLKATEMLAKQLGTLPAEDGTGDAAAVAEAVMNKILTAFDRSKVSTPQIEDANVSHDPGEKKLH